MSVATDKQKSLGMATLIYLLLLILLFFIRFWPPSNLKELMGGGGGGIEMNFGDSDFGLGKDFKSEVVNVKDQVKVQPANPTQQEDIITDDNTASKAFNGDGIILPRRGNIILVILTEKLLPT